MNDKLRKKLDKLKASQSKAKRIHHAIDCALTYGKVHELNTLDMVLVFQTELQRHGLRIANTKGQA